MTAKVPAFTDIGKSARDVLLGGREGVFQYNQLVTISSKTADGVEFTTTALKKDDQLETAVKAAYKYKNITSAATFNNLGKVTASAVVSDVTPGLSLSLLGTLPEIQSAKVGIDYYLPHLTVKSLIGLTAAPTVNINASSGWNDLAFGGSAVLETAKDNNLTYWTAGIGYTGKDYQIAALLTDKGDTLKLSGAHVIDSSQSLAAELSRGVQKEDTTLITIGYQKRLDNGVLAKTRLDNQGILHLLYELEPSKNHKLAFSAQLDATNLNKAPKLGAALDIKN